MPLSSSFLWSLFLQAALLPFAVTLVLLFLGRRVEMRRFDALAVTAGFLAAYFVIDTQFSFPPLQALDWLPLLLAALLGIAALRDLLPSPSTWAVPAVLIFAALVVLLWPLLKRGDISFLFDVSVAAVAWWGIWHYLDRESHDTEVVALVIIAVAAGNAVIAAETGSILTGQLCGVLAASVAGWLLWQAWRTHSLPAHGVIAVSLLALGSLIVVGRVYADTAAPPVFLSLAGFVAVPLSRLLERRRSHYAVLFLTGLAALVPVAVSIFLALRVYAGAAGEY